MWKIIKSINYNYNKTIINETLKKNNQYFVLCSFKRNFKYLITFVETLVHKIFKTENNSMKKAYMEFYISLV